MSCPYSHIDILLLKVSPEFTILKVHTMYCCSTPVYFYFWYLEAIERFSILRQSIHVVRRKKSQKPFNGFVKIFAARIASFWDSLCTFWRGSPNSELPQIVSKTERWCSVLFVFSLQEFFETINWLWCQDSIILRFTLYVLSCRCLGLCLVSVALVSVALVSVALVRSSFVDLWLKHSLTQFQFFVHLPLRHLLLWWGCYPSSQNFHSSLVLGQMSMLLCHFGRNRFLLYGLVVWCLQSSSELYHYILQGSQNMLLLELTDLSLYFFFATFTLIRHSKRSSVICQ